jgi:hypothetical protein
LKSEVDTATSDLFNDHFPGFGLRLLSSRSAALPSGITLSQDRNSPRTSKKRALRYPTGFFASQ